jgi:hypothetical protein
VLVEENCTVLTQGLQPSAKTSNSVDDAPPGPAPS